MAYN
ncbi:hypothetical protein ECFDA506_4450, partial [Escherichia coli FDA506]|jgi:response regulator RpfG family c-di-GMP phosphodiesterase